jgi:hypothetical protein
MNMISNGSSIPGPKPPAASTKRTQASSTFPVDQDGSTVASSLSGSVEGKVDAPKNHLDATLNRPTSEIVHEASAVVNWVVEDSKTVGGLGVNLLTVCALVVASPWSWIGMLLFGPVRVWGVFYAGVLAGINTALGAALLVLLLLVLVVVAVVGWVIVRAIF